MTNLEKKLRTLDPGELFVLVCHLAKNKKTELVILEWLKKNFGKLEYVATEEKTFLNDELLKSYWQSASKIIAEFNRYGGGEYGKENKAYRLLEKISKLIAEGNISPAAKIDFINGLFIEYHKNNSGFNDTLMDIIDNVCKTNEEWQYVVQKLNEEPNDWNRTLVMRIQKDKLGDDNAYLKKRMQKLEYGSDYWDLVKFYNQHKQPNKAVETAEFGLEKGQGSLIELFEFLFNYYAKDKNDLEINRIVNIAIDRKSDEKEMLDKLFEYYKKHQDYQRAKEALLRSFEFTGNSFSDSGYFSEYKKIKKFLVAKDWQEIEPMVMAKAKKNNIDDYLEICLSKNLKKEAIEIMLRPIKTQWGYEVEHNFDSFVERLEADFPDKIVEYYWQKSLQNIKVRTRDSYMDAAIYLKKAKRIYVDRLKNQSEWRKRFDDLKILYAKRPAFLDEVRDL